MISLVDFDEDIQKIKMKYENKLNMQQIEICSLKAKLEEQAMLNKTISSLFSLESKKLDFLTTQIEGYLESTNNNSNTSSLKRK